MPRKRVKITIQCRDVDSAVNNSLTSVDQHRHAAVMRHSDYGRQVGARSEYVGSLRDADDPRAVVDQSGQFLDFEPAVVRERHHAQFRPFPPADQLPRNDVRMMLHLGRDDIVAGSDITLPEAIRHRIDRRRSSSRKHDLARRTGPDKRRDVPPRGLVFVRTGFAHKVQAPVYVGVHLAVQVIDLIDHRIRLLGRSAVIEIDQRLTVNPAGKHRKIGAYFLNIEFHYIRSILSAASRSIRSVRPSTGVRSTT